MQAIMIFTYIDGSQNVREGSLEALDRHWEYEAIFGGLVRYSIFVKHHGSWHPIRRNGFYIEGEKRPSELLQF